MLIKTNIWSFKNFLRANWIPGEHSSKTNILWGTPENWLEYSTVQYCSL